MMSQAFRLVGAEQLAIKLRQAGDRAMPIIAGALNEIGDEIMAVSKREAPWDVGNLRDSITTYPPEIHGTEAVATIGAGGAAIPYALYQHEAGGRGADFNHPKGGKWHYLSDPTKQAGFRFAVNMANKLRGRLERALAR
jgi:hypothetical protein